MTEFEVLVEKVIQRTNNITVLVKAASMDDAVEKVEREWEGHFKNHPTLMKFRVTQVDMRYLDEDGAQHCLLRGMAPWKEREEE